MDRSELRRTKIRDRLAGVHLSLLLGLVSTTLTVRVGAAELALDGPLPLGGYTARGGKLCELPGAPLSARVLLFSQGSESLAVVSVDMLTVPESLYEEVRRRLPAKTELFLTATHTHCAPDSQMLNRRMDFALPGIAKFNAVQLGRYAEMIAAAVLVAREARAETIAPLTIQVGHRKLNRARRGMAYPDTMAVRVSGADDDPLLTHYAAHAVLYGPAHNRPDPDFPGRIRGERGLFLPGAIGDMSPASQGADPKSQIEHFAREFESGPWTDLSSPSVPFGFLKVPLAPGPVSPNPEFARLNNIPAPFAETIVKRFAPESGFLTLFRIGKLAVVGVPGEPTAEIGRRIRSIGLGLGFRVVLTVSHCNGWMGYILMPDDYARGGYEASLGFHGPDFGRHVVDKAREGLAALRDGRTGLGLYGGKNRRQVEGKP